MSSRRHSRSRSPDRRRETMQSSSSRAAGSGRLRMDRNPAHSRITDPSEPAGRRREIDTVMKRARASPNSNGYWDKKLLEVEEKDPNRWRHTGYKALYITGSSSPSPSRRSGRRSRTRSRSRGRRSPPPQQPPRQSRTQNRPRSPPARPTKGVARSPSASSLSSCSDDSCSVCSPKHRGGKQIRSRSRSFSVPRSRPPMKARPAPVPVSSSKPPAPSRPRARGPASPPLPPPETSRKSKPEPRRPPQLPPSRPRARNGELIELSSLPPAPPPEKQTRRPKQRKPEKVPSSKKTTVTQPVLMTRIKTERKKKSRRTSPPADSSGSDDSSASDAPPIVSATRLTLSERFGKMAQWSVDRRDIENMRITKNSSGGDLKVMIEEDDMLYGSPPPRYSHSPAPAGHFPDELLTTGPSGLASWDDVRVRYQYYKERGYLRDLTLDDYIKWEEWWYKYQEWLKAERYYEHWMQQQQQRRRRKRIPAIQRLN